LETPTTGATKRDNSCRLSLNSYAKPKPTLNQLNITQIDQAA